MKANPRNPRKISEKALAGLSESISEFGDISGIVFNARSGHLVCGHQRLEAMKLRASRDAVTLTIDDGFVILPASPNGSRPEIKIRIREVDWDARTETAAMLAANNTAIQGEWTDDVAALLSEIDDDLSARLMFDDLGDDPITEKDLKPMTIDKSTLPELAWCLVGLPIARWHEVVNIIEQLKAIPDITIETTVSNAR